MVETKKFKMHPALLFSVIKAQAGTHEKALLEAVMNAVDAGALTCEIDLKETGFSVRDNGKGFKDKKEIEDFFETFGTPHEEGDAVYGRFRMGRGQLFSFAKTKWRTSTFEMEVDIKEKGADFLFKEGLDPVKGCHIEGLWYKALSFNEIYAISRELEKLVKYIEIPVFINGKNITTPAEKEKWDFEDEDFYIKLSSNSGTLSVYNMGALVSNYPSYRFGISGTVVSKKALKINFARNDVLVSECPIWKKLIVKSKELLGLVTEKKKVLTLAERTALLTQIVNKEKTICEFIKKGLLTDISNKKISFNTILSGATLAISSGNRDKRKAEEKINDSKSAVVLHFDTLAQFGVDNYVELAKVLNELIDFNNKAARTHWNSVKTDYLKSPFRFKILSPIKIVDIEVLTKGISTKAAVLSKEKLSKRDVLVQECIDAYINKPLVKSLNILKNTSLKERKLLIGDSETYLAWTDGRTYVALNKKFIKDPDPLEIINILLHEYCHEEPSLEEHDHDAEFYLNYHDRILKLSKNFLYIIGVFSKRLNEILLKNGFKPVSYNYYSDLKETHNEAGSPA